MEIDYVMGDIEPISNFHDAVENKSCGNETFEIEPQNKTDNNIHQNETFEVKPEPVDPLHNDTLETNIIKSEPVETDPLSFNIPIDCSVKKEETSDIESFNCNKCEMQFDSKAMLKKHKKKLHGRIVKDRKIIATVECPDCKIKHKFLPEKVDLECDFCDKVFSNNICLKNHQRKIHKFYCLACKEIFTSKILLCRHKIEKHNLKSKTFKCDQCDKVYSGYSAKIILQNHIISVHKGKIFQCQKCDKKFKCNTSLGRHVQAIHTVKRGRSQCELCEKSFINHQKLKSHIESVHQDLKYPCDLCNIICVSSYKLTIHKWRVHRGEVFECDICEKRYKKKETLKDHINAIHFGIFSYCDICEKRFPYRWELSKHKSFIHSDPMVFKCDSCERSYNTKDGLRVHKRKHNQSTSQLFNCKSCDKIYKTRNELRVHFHHKHKDRKIKCDKCSKLFAFKSILKAHQRFCKGGLRKSKSAMGKSK